MIKELKFKKEIFGYIIKYKKKNGVNFLTPSNLSHQIAVIKHKEDIRISRQKEAIENYILKAGKMRERGNLIFSNTGLVKKAIENERDTILIEDPFRS